MQIDEMKKHIAALAAKAAEQVDGGEAMKFSQAANNIANALCAALSAGVADAQ